MTDLREMIRKANGGRHGEFVLTLRRDGVEIRPKRVRREGARVVVSWAWLYEQALAARPVKKRGRRVRRGLL